MDPNRKSDRILSEWDAIVHRAQRPATAPRRHRSLAGVVGALGIAGGGVLAAALIVAVVALGGRISSNVGVGPSGTPSASQIAVASPAATASPEPTASTPAHPATPAPTTITPTVRPTPTPVAACAASDLRARITRWEGAAGSRIADVTITNTGATCVLDEPTGVDLIDGGGATLISGRGPSGSGLTLAAGASASTLVEDSNYCGSAPKAPVTLRFHLSGHAVTAQPLAPTDATLPPCNGPTVPASIQMQPWSR